MGRILRPLAGAVAVVLLALLAAGCGKGDAKLAQVEGKVYYRGVPLQGGYIVFTPDAERGGSGPEIPAEIRRDGSYSLRTDNEAGASPGWYCVTITAEPPLTLPDRYSDPELSRECHEVKPGVVNLIDIRLD